MPQINTEFLAAMFKVNAEAQKLQLNPPWLDAANEWTGQQLPMLVAGTGRAAAMPIRGTTIQAKSGSFDEAVLAAVRTSPKGADITELQPILASWGKPNNQIGAALARLSKQQKIVKGTDNLWHYRSTDGKTVNRTLGTRRRQTKATGIGRQRKQPATTAANETQPLAAAG